MTIIRFCLAAFGCFLFSYSTQAQSYKTAAGIRVDNGFNITVQQHIFNNWTVEGIVHTSLASKDLGLTILAEKHKKILFRGLNLYYGAGAHYYGRNEPSRTETELNNNVFGLSFIGGAEVSLGRINLAIDWKPELHLTETNKAFDWNGASLSVRYIFAKREKKRIKDWKIFGGGKKKKK
jgi:hypothetical protein